MRRVENREATLWVFIQSLSWLCSSFIFKKFFPGSKRNGATSSFYYEAGKRARATH
jgi:hypothetical protein